jgi:hypothetical protein
MLLVFICYCYQSTSEGNLLCWKFTDSRITGNQIFDVLDTYMKEHKIAGQSVPMCKQIEPNQ